MNSFEQAWAFLKGLISVRGGDKPKCPVCGDKMRDRGAGNWVCDSCGYNTTKPGNDND